MTKRHRLTTAERVAVFKDHGGICHLCNLPILAGVKWEVSHPKPLEMGGADDKTNWRPAHFTCHRVETRTKDIPQIAHAKRIEAKHLGAESPKAKIPAPPKAPRVSKPPVARQFSIYREIAD